MSDMKKLTDDQANDLQIIAKLNISNIAISMQNNTECRTIDSKRWKKKAFKKVNDYITLARIKSEINELRESLKDIPDKQEPTV